MIQIHPLDMRSDGTLTWPFFATGVFCAILLLGPAVAPAQAQDSSDPSKQEKMTHYTLYYENFKNDNFKSARSDLLWMLENAPGFPQKSARNYRRVVELYEGLAEGAADEQTRKAYLDTAATYLTSAPQKMEQQGIQYEPYAWEVRKGRFLENYGDTISDVEGLESPVSHYRKAFELAPNELNPYYIRRVLESYLDQSQLKKALNFANMVEENRGDDSKVSELIGSVREQVFSMNPQAQIAYLEQQVEQYPDSTQLLTKLFESYSQQGNVSKASELAPRLIKMEPPAETIRQIAQMRLENGRPKAALQAYEQAIEQGAELQAEDYFNRGSAYQEMGELSNAREEYRKALDMKEDFGRAYLAIGDLYALSVNQCSGGEMTRNDKAVYWAAVDKYQQAKRVDSSVTSTANTKIKRYKEVFPNRSQIFLRDNWEVGQSMTIDYGCYSWIGETTTVRPAPSSG